MGKSIRSYLGINPSGEREDGRKLSHEEQYTAIVNLIGLNTCIRYIPATKEEIQKALESDCHLNNIPIKKWDNMHDSFKREFIQKGINILSLSDTVCTLKQAARMWDAQSLEKEASNIAKEC